MFGWSATANCQDRRPIGLGRILRAEIVATEDMGATMAPEDELKNALGEGNRGNRAGGRIKTVLIRVRREPGEAGGRKTIKTATPLAVRPPI